MMKFNKLLLATLLASTTLLTACKDCDCKNATAQPQNMAPVSQTVAQVQASQPTQVAQPAQLSELDRLNQSVSIRPFERGLELADQQNPKASFSYKMVNTSGKGIKRISFINVYSTNGQVLHNTELTLNFNPEFAPNAQQTLNMNIPFKGIKEQFRQVFLDPKANINAQTIIKVVEFSDGNRIVNNQQ